jgi:hypothetical protein
MMIFARVPKSKHKKSPKQVREQYDNWLKSHQPQKILKTSKKNETLKGYTLSAPVGRETKHIPSLNTGAGVAVKQETKIYTGTKVLGIATMHKSNAVPVFNSEEAVQISSMRR